MPWSDYKLIPDMPSNIPLLKSQFDAIKAGVMERLYVARLESDLQDLAQFDLSFHLKAIFIENQGLWKSELELSKIDYYLWELLPQYYYYYDDNDNPAFFTESKLEELVGTRVYITNPVSYFCQDVYLPIEWLNQKIKILNLLINCAPILSFLPTNPYISENFITAGGIGNSSWEETIQAYLDNNTVIYDSFVTLLYMSRRLDPLYYYNNWRITACQAQKYTTLLISSTTYSELGLEYDSYLNGDARILFRTSDDSWDSYSGHGDYTSINGSVKYDVSDPNTYYSLWKSVTGLDIANNFEINDYIIKEQIVAGNAFDDPTSATNGTLNTWVLNYNRWLFLDNITFRYRD